MTTDRTLARTAGILYLVTFATSIPALALKAPYLAGATTGPSGVHAAVILEVLLAFACLGTAIAMHSILARHSPSAALGFVASRGLEAALVMLGVVALLALVSARDSSSPDAASALVAVHDQAFLLGPGLLPAVNALLFATVLHRARLVPRIIPLIGLIGAPLLLASATLSILGLVDQVSPLAGLAALPIAVWEFAIGAWLIVKGVRCEGAPHREATQLV